MTSQKTGLSLRVGKSRYPCEFLISNQLPMDSLTEQTLKILSLHMTSDKVFVSSRHVASKLPELSILTNQSRGLETTDESQALKLTL